MRPINHYGLDTEELAEYFTENLRDNDLSRSSRKLWGLYLTNKNREPETREWTPDINRIFKAQSSEEHSYNWEKLAEDFEGFLEERINDVKSEKYPDEIEDVLNRGKPREPEKDLTSEHLYNLGYIESGLDGEPPQNTSEIFMTSVACFYDDDNAESYGASIEHLETDEALDAIEFLLERKPQAVEDLTTKGFRRGQTNKALKAYSKILEEENIILAQNILDSISDEKTAARARSMLIESSPSYFEGLKDVFDT